MCCLARLWVSLPTNGHDLKVFMRGNGFEKERALKRATNMCLVTKYLFDSQYLSWILVSQDTGLVGGREISSSLSYFYC